VRETNVWALESRCRQRGSHFRQSNLCVRCRQVHRQFHDGSGRVRVIRHDGKVLVDEHTLSAASDTWRQVAPRLLHMIVVIGRRPVCAQRSPCSRPTSGRTCINCMLCHLACPSYALEPVFLGPAAIAIAQRYNLDSRDEGSSKRIDALSAPDGVWGCTSVGECTSVCPEGDDPAGAVAAPAAALQRWCHGDSSAHAVILLLFGMIFPLELVAPPDHKHLLVLDYPLIRVVLSECACSPSSIARTASTISFAIVCN
jgi:ferredoxin